MLKAYYITEVEDQSILDQLHEMDVLVDTSKAVKRPSNSSLLPLWAKTILETERDKIDGSEFVILDGSMNDKFGYYMMLGMAIGKRMYKSSITVLNDDFANDILKDIYDNRSVNMTFEECINIYDLDIRYKDQSLITLVANGDVNSINFNPEINRKDPRVAILLGICYERGISVNYSPKDYNLFIDLITKR